MLDAYEPAANRIANTVAVGFVQERERIIRQQQEAIRELSTPVLRVRERLLILPIIGLIDPQRARQLTEQLLRGIRENRGKVAVMDITGVPAIDSAIANRLVQTVEAARLLGATVIVTGLSPEIAQTLVTIGVDLSKMNTVGDLQGGIELAERVLGYKVVPVEEVAAQPLATAATVSDAVGAAPDATSPPYTGPPMAVPILKQSHHLIASIQSALSDQDLLQLRDDLADLVGRHRALGVIIDVTALDVLDSFATRTLRAIAYTTKLRGAETVIVGIQPDVALAMVQLGLTLEDVLTALDLEEGLALLDQRLEARHGSELGTARCTCGSRTPPTSSPPGSRAARWPRMLGFLQQQPDHHRDRHLRGRPQHRRVRERRRNHHHARRRCAARRACEIVAADQGPGIVDSRTVMRDGYSTSKGLGIGLPGAQAADGRVRDRVGDRRQARPSR